MGTTTTGARFPLGMVVMTRGIESLVDSGALNPAEFLARHQGGDWGDVSANDRHENEVSVREGYRVLSSYTVGDVKFWIITEADRSSTCVLLPSEY